LTMDEIASIAVSAALAEIRLEILGKGGSYAEAGAINREALPTSSDTWIAKTIAVGDGARYGGCGPTKPRGRGLSENSSCSTSTHDYSKSICVDSCSISTLSYDYFAHYDGNQLLHTFAKGGCECFSALYAMFCCQKECNDDGTEESRGEDEPTSDRFAEYCPSRDGIAITLEAPQVLFSDTGSIYSIVSKDSFRECTAKPPKDTHVLFSDSGSCYSIESKYDQGKFSTLKGGLRKKGNNWNLWTTP
jgi:hypothetical protein